MIDLRTAFSRSVESVHEELAGEHVTLVVKRLQTKSRTRRSGYSKRGFKKDSVRVMRDGDRIKKVEVREAEGNNHSFSTIN